MTTQADVQTWVARPNVEVRKPSKVDMIRRDRSTVLICRAAARGLVRPLELASLYRELVADSGPSRREMHVKATAITTAAAYLADRPTGELWAFVAGERTDPADVSFETRVDAIGYCDEDDWTIDVVSVAVRPGQLTADLSGGRVMRSVRAVEQFMVPGGAATIRVWSHQAQTPRLAATVHVAPIAAPAAMVEMAS